MYWIEITTQIGCKNMCSYCPQTALTTAYKDSKRKMTLEDFKIILNNTNPLTTKIHFSGFSEPFLTPEAEIMMVVAYQKGFIVLLNTTLEGFTEDKCKRLSNSNINFEAVFFHEYDGVGFNKEKFLKYRDMFTTNVKSNFYSTAVIDEPISRAGNNWKVNRNLGSIKCKTNRYYGNVVLPNGDLYLCCNDFGLKHKIGNIYEKHYESIEFNNKREEIISLCEDHNDSDVLCRTCEKYNMYTLGYKK